MCEPRGSGRKIPASSFDERYLYSTLEGSGMARGGYERLCQRCDGDIYTGP